MGYIIFAVINVYALNEIVNIKNACATVILLPDSYLPLYAVCNHFIRHSY